MIIENSISFVNSMVNNQKVSKEHCNSVTKRPKYIQSNFNGSNTFGTIKISSRKGYFKPMGVDYSARSGGIIGIIFRFSLT